MTECAIPSVGVHAAPQAETPLLQVENLSIHIGTKPVVDNVSFSINRGETLGLVGESGSGKSITCLSILKLLPKAGSIAGGRILFRGEDIVRKSEREMRSIRGRDLAMILQDPMTSLNPVFTVGNQVAEPIRQHQGLRSSAVWLKAAEALRLLRIPDPERRLKDYPHQMSGGMRQRALGAIALSCEPDLIIADEPTTSLDVTVQAQYLKLLRDIQRERGVAIIFVTHDLSIVSRMCHRVAVMYAGRIVEYGPVRQLFERPVHPYTKALLSSIPQLNERPRRLRAIDGQPAVASEHSDSCAFAPRCSRVSARCENEKPPSLQTGEQIVSCWHAGDR